MYWVDIMSNEIEVKIHENHVLYAVLATFGVLGFVMSCIYFLFALSLLMLLLMIFCAALTVLFFYLALRPTVVWCDGEQLRWKYLFREHGIYLTEITDVLCEPYESYSRYGAVQRIRLTLRTGSMTGDIEFTDSVNAGDLIDEKLGKKKDEIPLLQLNAYLRKHCGRQ